VATEALVKSAHSGARSLEESDRRMGIYRSAAAQQICANTQRHHARTALAEKRIRISCDVKSRHVSVLVDRPARHHAGRVKNRRYKFDVSGNVLSVDVSSNEAATRIGTPSFRTDDRTVAQHVDLG
jgi:hypothetical protein